MWINFLRAAFAMFWVIPCLGWLIASERNRVARRRLRDLQPHVANVHDHAVARRAAVGKRWDTQARLNAEIATSADLAMEVVTLRRALRDMERQRDRANARSLYGK